MCNKMIFQTFLILAPLDALTSSRSSRTPPHPTATTTSRRNNEAIFRGYRFMGYDLRLLTGIPQLMLMDR